MTGFMQIQSQDVQSDLLSQREEFIQSTFLLHWHSVVRNSCCLCHI